MLAEQLVINEKYTPISKSVGDILSKSIMWRSANEKDQNYLYYHGKQDSCFLFNHIQFDKLASGDFFLPSDMIEYTGNNDDYQIF